jgi:hypothetical protein
MTFARSLISAAALGFAMSGAASAEGHGDQAGLVTVVTSGDAQTQLMAMVLTSQAVAQGHSARILLCGEGGALGLADAPEAATAPQPPRGASPQGLMGTLMEQGVTVEVCAIFLPGMGADASVLMPGIGVAQPPAMAGAMMAEGTQVWSF